MPMAMLPIRCAAVAMLAGVLCACGDSDSSSARASIRSEGPPDETLVVTCTADATEIDQSAVEAAADGVRVRVVDESGAGLQVRTEHDDRRAGSHTLTAGESSVALPPGRSLVLCSTEEGPEHMLAPSDSDESVEVEVQADPTLWKRAVLECDLVSSTISDFGEEPGSDAPHPGDPVETVRAAFPWLTEQDTVEKAGYPEHFVDHVPYRVQRNGEVVAVASVMETGNGWVLHSSEVCAEVLTPPP